jgi:hypothetical protein
MNRSNISVALTTGLLLLPVTGMATDVSITGFIRQETAVATGNRNLYNESYGNSFNQRTTPNTFGTPITRDKPREDTDWNLNATRAELDFKVRFNPSWEGFAKIRGVTQWGMDDEFDDFYDSGFNGGKGSVMETNGDDYMLDVAALYLDYNNGPFWLRVGQQQIAWGEAIFFRVFDVPNGLDLRRHSILGVAAEEYSDSRVPSLGIRGSYRFDNDWEVESFVQQFRPSVLGPQETPYNFVGSQFRIDQSTGWNDKEDDFNFGVRLSGSVGRFDLQFMYSSRVNPDGVFRWTESGINPFAGTGVPELEGLGALLAETPFEMTPDGVWISDEWFEYAGLTRLDGVNGLNSSVRDFPAAQALGAFVVDEATCQALLGTTNLRDCANFELDLFYDTTDNSPPGGGLGPLAGHIIREYDREDIFGAGFTYVFNGEPNSLLDQLVLRTEFTFTPDRKFTNIGLDREYIEEDEFISNVSLEKYHRFSSAFPASYFVLQWMHKSESDLLGRHVDGFDTGKDGRQKGEDYFNALAFALQQPFPGLIWRADLTVLYDVNGGVLVQPGVKWRPRDDLQLDVYYNYIDSDGDNDDVLQTFERMDEMFARLTWYF